MPEIDKMELNFSHKENEVTNQISQLNRINFQDKIYSNFKYPGVEPFFNFFCTDTIEYMDDEKYYPGMYYYGKTCCRLLSSIVTKFEKGETPDLLDFLTKVFFATRDSRIGRIPMSINKRAEGIKDMINWEKLKEAYPLASRSNDHLLTNKTFLEGVKNDFLWDYCSKNPDFYENITNQIKDITDPKELYKEFIEILTNLETTSHEMEIYVRDYLAHGVFERFRIDNEKKEKKNKDIENIKNNELKEDKKEMFNNLVNGDEVEMFSNINLLNEGQLSLIDEIVHTFNKLGEKNQKKIRKFLVRLIINKKPFKVDSFLKIYNLDSLAEDVILMLDDLGIDVVLKKDKEEDEEFNIEIIEKNLDDSKNNSIESTVEIINKKLLSLFIADPLSAIIEKARLCGYEIENENLLKKQIEYVCKSSKYVKDSLLLSLFKESFSRPILKHSGAYSLRAGGSGYRFVLRHDGGRFIIVGFYNHDDYEKVIDGRKW